MNIYLLNLLFSSIFILIWLYFILIYHLESMQKHRDSDVLNIDSFVIF